MKQNLPAQPAALNGHDKLQSIKRLFPNTIIFLKWIQDNAVFYRALEEDAVWLKTNLPELCSPFSQDAPDAADVFVADAHIENALRRVMESGYKVAIIEDWQNKYPQ